MISAFIVLNCSLLLCTYISDSNPSLETIAKFQDYIKLFVELTPSFGLPGYSLEGGLGITGAGNNLV